MYRFLVVGDPHVSPSNIEDARKLMEYATELAICHQAELLILGDLHHNHAIMHLKVFAFWTGFLQYLDARGVTTTLLVGNHDMVGDGNSDGSSLMAYKEHPSVFVVDSPVIRNGFLFLPYIKDNDRFIRVCNERPTRVAFCHATFDGAQFENGFFAKDGIDSTKIPQETVISGHIHISSKFGKVWYPGSPRWLTLSDANQDKAIWYLEFDKEYNLIKHQAYQTDHVCRKIYHLEDREKNPLMETTLKAEHEYRVDIYGSAAYIEQRTPLFQAQGAKIRSFKDQTKQVRVKESDGVQAAFSKWCSNFKPSNGSDTYELQSLIKERLNDQIQKEV